MSREAGDTTAAPARDTGDLGAASDDATTETTGTGVTIEREEGPMPGPKTVLASVRGQEVTLEEFEYAAKQSFLHAPDAILREPGRAGGDERLAYPSVQINAVRGLLEDEIVRAEAARRGIEVSPEEIESYLREDPELSRFVAPAPGEQPRFVPGAFGLSRADLEDSARSALLRDRLAERLLADIDERKLWEIYRRSVDQVDLAIASLENTPTSRELDRFVARQGAQIEKYFEEHPERYRTPRTVRLALLRPPAGRSHDEPGVLEKLRTAAARLRDGADPETVATQLGLRVETEAHLVRGENREAFGAAPGATGVEIDGPRGTYAWRVAGHRESRALELGAGLRREIAATLLSSEQVTPTSRARLMSFRREMAELCRLRPRDGLHAAPDGAIAKLEERAEKRSLAFTHTGMFSKTERGFVPKIGLAEAVHEAAFRRLDPENPVVDAPVLSRGKAHVFCLVGRRTPDRETFEREKEAFREALERQKRQTVVRDFLAGVMQDARMDLKPLRIKYGVARKGPR
jgi:hypothetical protein